MSASSRSMPKTTWAPAARRIATSPRSPNAIRSRCMASACRSAAARPLDKAHLTRLQALDRPLPAAELSPSIWPGRRMTAASSTTCCRCPTPTETLARVARPCRRGAAGARPADAARKPVDLRAVRGKHDRRDRFPGGDRPRAPAAACCSTSTMSWSRRSTTGSTPIAYIDRFPVELVGEIHLAGYRRDRRRRRRPAADRCPWHARSATMCFALYEHTLARSGTAADADRMGQ